MITAKKYIIKREKNKNNLLKKVNDSFIPIKVLLDKWLEENTLYFPCFVNDTIKKAIHENEGIFQLALHQHRLDDYISLFNKNLHPLGWKFDEDTHSNIKIKTVEEQN